MMEEEDLEVPRDGGFIPGKLERVRISLGDGDSVKEISFSKAGDC